MVTVLEIIGGVSTLHHSTVHRGTAVLKISTSNRGRFH